MKAVARVPDPYEGMNGIEKARAVELEALRRADKIAKWDFERVTLVLADGCRYTPDFLVTHNDGRLVVEETKGWWREDARVKIKVAAAQFPQFYFRALVPRRKKDGGGWAVEEF